MVLRQYGGATEDDLYQDLQEAGGDMLPPGLTSAVYHIYYGATQLDHKMTIV